MAAFRIDRPSYATYAGLIAAPGDDAPETFAFATAEAPDGVPVLFVANKVSGNSRAFALARGGDAAGWHGSTGDWLVC